MHLLSVELVVVIVWHELVFDFRLLYQIQRTILVNSPYVVNFLSFFFLHFSIPFLLGPPVALYFLVLSRLDLLLHAFTIVHAGLLHLHQLVIQALLLLVVHPVVVGLVVIQLF